MLVTVLSYPILLHTKYPLCLLNLTNKIFSGFHITGVYVCVHRLHHMVKSMVCVKDNDKYYI